MSECFFRLRTFPADAVPMQCHISSRLDSSLFESCTPVTLCHREQSPGFQGTIREQATGRISSSAPSVGVSCPDRGLGHRATGVCKATKACLGAGGGNLGTWLNRMTTLHDRSPCLNNSRKHSPLERSRPCVTERAYTRCFDDHYLHAWHQGVLQSPTCHARQGKKSHANAALQAETLKAES